MTLVETIPNITEVPFKNLEISPIQRMEMQEIDNNSFDVSLNYVSEGCKKSEKKKIFKQIYQNLMWQNPNATYQEKLDIANKYIGNLQEQNPDVHPNVFKSMKRSFAAKTGYEITRLKRELKNSESTVTLDNGKEFHYSHPWKNIIEKTLGDKIKEKKTERSLLIKFLDLRTKMRSIINLNNPQNPDEILKICENYIAGKLKIKDNENPDNFLSERSIIEAINPQESTPLIYLKERNKSMERLIFPNLDLWISSVIRSNS